jgi:glycosyltransferase involved in cell wall biosynthesis
MLCGEMKVSIVMPCFRMGRFLPRALASVKSQTYGNWQLIAVDDCGPDDGTTQAVSNFMAGYDDGRVTLIRHATNQGVGAARNTAIALATGDLIAFLDPDDYWESTFLRNNIDRFVNGPQVDVVASPVFVVTDETVTGPVQILGITPFEKEIFPQSLAIGSLIQPSAAVVRAEILRTVGGFTTDKKLQHIEDWDLWIRLVKAGASFDFIDQPLAFYRKHDGGATSDEAKTAALTSSLIEEHRGWFDVNQLKFLKTLSYNVGGLREQALRLDRPTVRFMLKIDQLISYALKPLFRSKR